MLCLCACISLHAEPRYVFYFIGDGMGPTQVLMAEMYLAELEGKIDRNKLFMTSMPYSGQVATFSRSNGITDSSAAGTALATGSKTNNGTLGITAEGDTLRSIAEILKEKGWGVGILTTVAIDHATPAAFYANVLSRDDYYEIGRQLAYTDFDIFAGAGFHKPDKKSKAKNDAGKKGGKKDSGRKDKKDKKQVIDEGNLYDLAEKHGYTIASGLEQAYKYGKTADKLIMVQPTDGVDRSAKGSNFPYRIDGRAEELRLKRQVEFATEYLLLRHKQFFMMVEGGMVDYACHSKDAGASLEETLDMDEAVGIALDFYRRYPDETLIVVTADHETGGMALGTGDNTLNLQMLKHQHCSAWKLSDEIKKLYKDDRQPEWKEVRALLEKYLDFYTDITIEDEEDEMLQKVFSKTLEKREGSDVKNLYKDINAIGDAAIQLLNKKAHLGWTSYSHTAAAVPVFAIGKGAELFTGWMDNTEIVPKILKCVGVEK